jgi:hypothetical protein
VKRFLRNPIGWIALQLVECALLLLLARELIRVFPYRSTSVYAGILAFALALTVGNYIVRRRYLQ